MKRLFKSLSAKLFFAIVIWLCCALCFMGLSLYFLWKLEDSGIAINQIGSLRMKTARIVLSAQFGAQQDMIDTNINDFQKTLSELESQIPSQFANPQETREQIQRIRTHANLFYQSLNMERQATSHLVRHETIREMDTLIAELNTLVKTIENNNTVHIQWLRIFQLTLFVLAIASAFCSVFFLNRLVIKPLNQLKSGIDKIGQGDFSIAIPKLSNDEFGIVTTGFNRMAQNIRDLYAHLEEKVQEQTLALKERNSELKILYDVTAFLHSTPDTEQMVKGFLKYIQEISFAQVVSIRLITQQGGEDLFFTGINNTDELNHIEQTFRENASSSAFQSNIIFNHISSSFSKATLFSQSALFHHTNKTNNIYLTLYFNQSCPLAERNVLLLESLLSQFATAIENQRLVTLDKQLAVLEERNLMAQGLHDSIAQSLSFLNMQTQMLKNALQKNNLHQACENIQFIQEGIQVSYEDVRELLTNFRTKLDTDNFQQSIHSVIKRFKMQEHIPVTLLIETSGEELNIGQQLQAIFILQEALSNIRKHAKAKHVSINIVKNEHFVMSIQDDGVGFSLEDKDSKQVQHIGLNIMQERAKRAHGHVNFETSPDKGTRITLKIEPCN